jgi:hypothetical protein
MTNINDDDRLWVRIAGYAIAFLIIVFILWLVVLFMWLATKWVLSA